MPVNRRLHPNEKIILEVKPLLRAVPYWMLTSCLRVLSSIIILIVFLSMQVSKLTAIQKFLPHSVGLFVPALILFALIFSILYLWFNSRCKAHSYCVTNQRCIFSYGIWTNNKAIVPFNRVADVYTYQNVLEKMFGITSLYVTDMGAATAMGYGRVGRRSSVGNRGLLRMQGLDEAAAEEILDTISQHISSVQTVRVESGPA